MKIKLVDENQMKRIESTNKDVSDFWKTLL